MSSGNCDRLMMDELNPASISACWDVYWPQGAVRTDKWYDKLGSKPLNSHPITTLSIVLMSTCTDAHLSADLGNAILKSFEDENSTHVLDTGPVWAHINTSA